MMTSRLFNACLLSTVLLVGPAAARTAEPDYGQLIVQAHQRYQADNTGKVADYIPALARYSPQKFGIAIATVDGKVYQTGDASAPFPMESLSKVFTLALVMAQRGPDEVLNKLGANATGLPFNSGLAVELTKGQPENPLVNAGAMSAVSLVQARNKTERWRLIAGNLNAYADAKLPVNEPVFASEMATNQHNQGLAQLMASWGSFYGDTREAVEIYTRQCSVDVTAVQLARMGAVLANNGKSPWNGQQLLNASSVPYVLVEMAIAGLYDGSGKWLYEVGLPAKSGVGGGMLAIAPGRYAIAVYSPPLDGAGNSVRGWRTIRDIAGATRASLFHGAAAR